MSRCSVKMINFRGQPFGVGGERVVLRIVAQLGPLAVGAASRTCSAVSMRSRSSRSSALSSSTVCAAVAASSSSSSSSSISSALNSSSSKSSRSPTSRRFGSALGAVEDLLLLALQALGAAHEAR